jgi:hypothetical protein
MKILLYVVLISSSALLHAQNCRIAGQISFADIVDHTITIKTDSGDLVDFHYDNATSFLRSDLGATHLLPEQLNNGDRLCVRKVEPVEVSVTPRAKIDAGQKKNLQRGKRTAFTAPSPHWTRRPGESLSRYPLATRTRAISLR